MKNPLSNLHLSVIGDKYAKTKKHNFSFSAWNRGVNRHFDKSALYVCSNEYVCFLGDC